MQLHYSSLGQTGSFAVESQTDTFGPKSTLVSRRAPISGQDLLRTWTMVVSATGHHVRPCDELIFSMRSRAFAHAPQPARFQQVMWKRPIFFARESLNV